MRRLLLDTNLLISGLMWQGLPRQLLNAARSGVFELCTSEVLLAELEGVLERAKFEDRLVHIGATAKDLVNDLRKQAIVVNPARVPRVVPTDPDDDHVLAAAVAGAVDLIVSGDRRDLLPLGSYAGIPIISADQAWAWLAEA